MIGCIEILKKSTLIYFSLTILVIGSSETSFAQDNSKGQAYETARILRDYVQKIYGTDDLVVNGEAYLPEHFNAKGNPYFLSNKWTYSTLVINGKEYDELKILYNIDIEKVILKTTINEGEDIMLILNTHFIDSFTIEDHYFINGEKNVPQGKFPGFVEEVFKGSFQVFARHQKSFVSQYTSTSPNGFYTGTKSSISIYDKGQITKLGTKKSLLQYFSPYKKEISKFMHSNKIKYNKATSDQLYQLFKFSDSISAK